MCALCALLVPIADWLIYACSCALQDFVHASSEGVATTGARWKAETRGGGDLARGVPAATTLLALSADMRCSCDVPGRPDMGDAGACFLSVLIG